MVPSGAELEHGTAWRIGITWLLVLSRVVQLYPTESLMFRLLAKALYIFLTGRARKGESRGTLLTWLVIRVGWT